MSATPRIVIPGVETETVVALQKVIDELTARLDKLEAGPTAPPLITSDYTAQVGQYVRFDAPPAGLKLLLPQPLPSNRGQSITLAFESTGPVTIRALSGTVNGEPYVVSSLQGTFQATSNGESNWSVALGLSSTGLPTNTGPQGEPGLQGKTGSQGPPAFRRDLEPGPRGFSIVGATGATGAPGFPGQDGQDGQDGLLGATGATGQQGPIGFSGQDGQDGSDGLPGATGAQGLPGLIGFPGQDGEQGPAGDFGFPGATGPSNGVPASFPPLTFFGNDATVTAVGAAQNLSLLAGSGLLFGAGLATAPTPTVLTLSAGEADNSGASISSLLMTLPAAQAIGDRIIFAVYAQNGTASVPGWAEISGGLGLLNGHSLWERVLDGTEGSTVTITTTVSGLMQAHQFALRGTDRTASSVVTGLRQGFSATTIDPPSVSVTWGAANTIFIGLAGLLNGGAVTGFPAALTGTSQVTLSTGNTFGFGFFSTPNTEALDLSIWTQGVASRMTAFTLAVPPLPVGAFSVDPSLRVRFFPSDGEAGQPGDPGFMGAQGAQGTPGLQGFPGQDGADGADGISFTPGPQGPTGADGQQGPAGTALSFFGQDGQDGADGISFTPGPQGPTGADGQQGPAGTALAFFGQDGQDGADGISFTPGPAGPAGAAGTALAFFGQDGTDGGDVFAIPFSASSALSPVPGKSIIANATNATAIPVASTSASAYQKLRVNGLNTALEWSLDNPDINHTWWQDDFDAFIGLSGGSVFVSETPWIIGFSGASATISGHSDASAAFVVPGRWELDTTTAGHFIYITKSASAYYRASTMVSFCWCIESATAVTAGSSSFECGLSDTPMAADTNSVIFYVNSAGTWQTRVSSGSGTDDVDSGIAYAANTIWTLEAFFYDLTGVVNVDFYINGAFVRTALPAKIPAVNMQFYAGMLSITTVLRGVLIDYCSVERKMLGGAARRSPGR